MLKLENIGLHFGRSILQNINLTIGKGEIIGIIGKSGAGKTSLLKLMAGLLQPTTGEVYFEDKKVLGPLTKLVPGHPDIQLVNQDFKLDTYHTVEENIREQILYLPQKERNDLVEDLLSLTELTDMRNQKANTLSGGEQQRLSIARALACEPKVVLLDEPFVHLDGRLRSKILNYLLKLREIRNTSLILVSHDGSEILSVSDTIIALKNGQITRKGKARDFYYKPRSIEEAKLVGAINSVKVKDKRIIFRPDEYQIVENTTLLLENVISVSFNHSLFTGPVYENYFTTVNKEKIVLFSFYSLQDVTQIHITQKN